MFRAHYFEYYVGTYWNGLGFLGVLRVWRFFFDACSFGLVGGIPCFFFVCVFLEHVSFCILPSFLSFL